MLLELKKYWIDKWYFIEKKLKDLSEANIDWLDKIEKKIIDFDETWKKFKKLSFKTADILDIKNNNNLNFIELKNIKNLPDIDDFIKSLNFDLKVQESFLLLRNIVSEKPFWTKERRKKINETKNKFIFSISWDITPQIDFLLTSEVVWLEDYDKTLEKVIWIETKDLKKYL
jgi:hypothetical protein